jgi:hypothetical protein
MSNTESRGLLLSIIELGGYPSYNTLYREAGYQVEMQMSGRKALSFLKKNRPAVVVAEFNYQTDFRDRLSNLDSILATVQAMPGTRVIVFYEKEFIDPLEQLRERFPGFQALSFPVDEEALRALL